MKTVWPHLQTPIKTLGTSGNSGDMPENIGSNAFPLDDKALGTSGNKPNSCSHCSHWAGEESEQETLCKNNDVPTVPSVPSEKHIGLRCTAVDVSPDPTPESETATAATVPDPWPYEYPYTRGQRLLAEALARDGLIPEPTTESVEKYFPSWRWRDLITQFGSSGEPPQALIDAVRMWEHLECGRAEDMRVPHAPWYQEAIAEWERIRDASRGRPPKGKPQPTPPTGSAEKHASDGGQAGGGGAQALPRASGGGCASAHGEQLFHSDTVEDMTMTADNRQKKSVWSPDFHYEMDDRPWEHENADWCSQAVSQLAESTGIAYEDCRRRFCIWVEGWLPQEVEELEGKNWTEYAQPWEPEPLPRLPHDVRVALREANRKYWVERLREWDDEAKAAGFGGIASREERIEAYMAYKRTEEAKAGR